MMIIRESLILNYTKQFNPVNQQTTESNQTQSTIRIYMYHKPNNPIKFAWYIDETKYTSNTRILFINPHGFIVQ